MIRLYLVRHGIAQEPEPGLADAHRALTGKGRRRLRKLFRSFAQLGEPVALVLTSPLLRAVQTAELLGEALGSEEIEVTQALLPDAAPQVILELLAKRLRPGQGAAVVGHDPGISRLLARVAELSEADAQTVDFRKGSIARVDVGSLPAARPAQARWWMKPKARVRVQGVPLRTGGDERGGR